MNAIDLLKEDSINRNGKVFQFIKLLDNIEDSCSIAINGDWGSGKTFFVKQAKLILDAYNETSNIDDDTRAEIIKITQSQFSEIKPQSTVYYDAWMYDNHEDPILSLMYAVINSGQSDYSPKNKRSLYKCGALFAELLASGVGIMSGNISSVVNAFKEVDTSTLGNGSLSKFLEEIKGQDYFENIKDLQSLHQMVEQFINSLIEERGNRLVFFIDELDRCKPDFAIKLLERIKHYFGDERITFVFSVDMMQLQSTVKSFYGQDFNSTRYLDKFFDLRMQLPSVDYESFLSYKMDFVNSDILDGVCIDVMKYFKLSLRECERYIQLIKISTRMAFNKFSMVDTQFYPEENAVLFASLYILPIMVGLQMTDINAYFEFVSGKNSKPLVDIISNVNNSILQLLIVGKMELYDNGTKEITIKRNETETIISQKDRIEEIYNAFFNHTYKAGRREKNIGKLNISTRTKQKLEEINSLLVEYSDYT